jgi:hypothetical protein
MSKLDELDLAIAALELYGHFGQNNIVATSENSEVPYSALWVGSVAEEDDEI